eukprot:COSAG04_NODE_320_length_16877_cov_26.485401_5_plen_78_part_01
MITPRHGTSFDRGTGASTILPLFSSLIARIRGQNHEDAVETFRKEQERSGDWGGGGGGGGGGGDGGIVDTLHRRRTGL